MPTAKRRVSAKPKKSTVSEKSTAPAAAVRVSQKAEILNTYHAIWDAVLKGDMKTFASYLGDHVTIYGSAEGEIFNTKKAAAKFYEATADEMTGKVDLRKRKIGIKALGNSAIINEECDLYVLTGNEWSFYGHARITEVLKRERGTWKISHHHTSFPDHRTEKGQQLASEKIEKENLELREAVKRRTVELEHKNRELAIEAAMEKVRARSLAMQKPEELAKVAEVLRKEMGALGVEELETSSIYIVDENKTITECWYAIKDVRGKNKKLVTDHMTLFLHETWVGREMQKFYRSKQIRASILMRGKNRKEWINYCASKSSVLQGYYGGNIPERTYHLLKFSNGFLGAASPGEISQESWDILQRATAVFSFAYKRFCDLQKAEAQAREAQTEAALERVRARAMAMHNSEELSSLVAVLFHELTKLNLLLSRCIIWIFNPRDLSARLWMANSEENDGARSYFVRKLDHPYYHAILEGWKQRKTKWVYELKGREKKAIDALLLKDTELAQLPPSVKKGILTSDHTVVSGSFNNFGLIEASGPIPHTETQLSIISRFGQVFDQAYTRFLDLQKAEAQAREAQIEAALERVRSSSMAMHKSEELHNVINVVAEQITGLGIKYDGASFTKINADKSWEQWIATPTQPYPFKVHIPYMDHPMVNSAIAAWRNDIDFIATEYSFEEKNSFFDHFFENTIAKNIPVERKKFVMQSKGLAVSAVPTKSLLLSIYNYECVPFANQENEVLKRFAKVFEQAYTRFLDLQRAEANAREATIEAALEKVRGKAMAMHNSNDLIATAGVLFAEMRKLGINTFRCGVGLLNKENRKAKLYSATATSETDNLPMVGSALLDRHEVLTEMYDRWLRNDDYFPVMKGDLLKTYYEKINSTFAVPIEQTEQYEQHGFFLSFSEGLFYGWAEKCYTEDEIKILHRFKAIVDLTFRRYMELQKSEEIAREAVRSASLDRVRAEIASMRTKQDLERITPLIWKELTTLGIPFVRCGVFIMDEQEQLIHTFLSTPEGKAIAAFHLPYSSSPFFDAIEEWRAKKIHITHWDTKGFAALAELLVKEGQIATPEQYLRTVPKEGLYLHYVPFLQGILYVGNTVQLTNDHLHLIQSVADAFSTAYARYEDFNKLEAAKTQIETTLKELRAAQNQLVQSEKMASLGELTAGIAHEIQNPLNFVNNFSEVSHELIAEMKSELEAGNAQSAAELAQNVSDNLTKINHHGKRAADIVKSMLQHSRTSTGQKELTDINVLCDEYLRLAFHGLRAKDKSFNAKFETNFDPSLPKVSVIPQDIGRVLLNLINNAFYAVSERLRQAQPHSGYEPAVCVSTKKRGDKIEISVKDNGNGIPDSIKEKIFQPFFTTKPTGQGTGLGLSLSYDVIKAHGGDINVETAEGKGTQFKLQLPVS